MTPAIGRHRLFAYRGLLASQDLIEIANLAAMAVFSFVQAWDIPMK